MALNTAGSSPSMSTGRPNTPSGSYRGGLTQQQYSNLMDQGGTSGGGIATKMVNGQAQNFSIPQQTAPVGPEQPSGGGQPPGGGAPLPAIDPLYPKGDINQATNFAAANAVVPLRDAMKQYIRPGGSISNSTVGSAMPAYAQGVANQAGAESIPFWMEQANWQHQTEAEQIRANNILNQEQLSVQDSENQLQQQLALLNPALNMFGKATTGLFS